MMWFLLIWVNGAFREINLSWDIVYWLTRFVTFMRKGFQIASNIRLNADYIFVSFDGEHWQLSLKVKSI